MVGNLPLGPRQIFFVAKATISRANTRRNFAAEELQKKTRSSRQGRTAELELKSELGMLPREGRRWTFETQNVDGSAELRRCARIKAKI